MRLLIISFFTLLMGETFGSCPDSLQQKFLKHLTENKMWSERLAFTAEMDHKNCETWKLEHAFSLSMTKQFVQSDSIYNACNQLNEFKNHRIWIAFKTRNTLWLSKAENLPDQAAYCLSLLITKPDSLHKKQGYQRLNNRYFEWQNVDKKSEFLAGFFSLVPGLGKLYCGYRKQALMSFIANVGLGAITLETLLKRGPQDALFYAVASLAATFYGGSIYGTVNSLQKEKKDRLDALYLEITERFLASYAAYPL